MLIPLCLSDVLQASARSLHGLFLEHFGLCASQVPLLRYSGSSFTDASVHTHARCPPPDAPLPRCLAGRAPVPRLGWCAAVSSATECELSLVWNEGKLCPF